MLHNTPGTLTWLAPVLVAAGIAGAVALAVLDAPKLRTAALGGVLALLLIAPATWAVQTLGHATSGTFPAGGPASAGLDGGPGGGGPGRFTRTRRRPAAGRLPGRPAAGPRPGRGARRRPGGRRRRRRHVRRRHAPR